MVPHFSLPLLFYFHETSLVEIKSKKQSHIATTFIKPVIEFFLFRKTDRLDCKIPYKKTGMS